MPEQGNPVTKPGYKSRNGRRLASIRDERWRYVDYPVHRARVRKSPYFESTRAAGPAAASVYNHMYMPTGYGDPAAEYERLIHGVAMWDVAVERQVALKGPMRWRWRYLTPRTLTG